MLLNVLSKPEENVSEIRLKIYSDGASRGNPGISAMAFMIMTEHDRVITKSSRYLGVRTNNQAEYEALISALESAAGLTDQEVTCYVDSELVVKQLNGKYRVRNLRLKALWQEVQELRLKFRSVTFKNVPRTDVHIEHVDQLANQALDKVGKTL